MSIPKYELIEKIISRLEDDEEIISVREWAYHSTLLSMIAEYLDYIHPNVFGEMDLEIVKGLISKRAKGP